MKTNLSVVIPMYNEAAILPDTVEKLRVFLDGLSDSAEILLVDDGSTDGSAEIARRCIGDDARLRVIGYEKNRGKGGAVRYGMLHSSGEIAVFTDCDLAYGTEVISQIASALRSRPEVKILAGSRRLSQDGYRQYSLLRRMMSRTYLTLIRLVTGFGLDDSQCGIKCFDGDVARQVFTLCEIDSFAFDLEALLIADKLGYPMASYPVTILNHREKNSKIRIFKDTFSMLGDIRRIKRRIRSLSLQYNK